MAIALDSSSKDAATFQSGTSFSWTHTCTGSDLYLIVAVFSYNNQGTLTAPTYNGVTMTLIQSTALAGPLNKLWLYGLANPATGANTVAFSFSISNSFVASVATSYTGVDQSTPIDVSATATETPGDATYNPAITTTVDNAWVVGSFRATQGNTFTGVVGTLREGAGALAMYNWDSNGAVTPAGTYTATITVVSGANEWSGIIAALKPAGGATPTPLRMLMGMGT
jgi:hypothetical protein